MHNKADTKNQGEEKMKNYPNIIKSFLPGEYVGYVGGQVWKIEKFSKGWAASVIQGNHFRLVTGANLQEISARLDIIDKHMKGEK